MDSSRIRDASRIRVYSLGPEAAGVAGCEIAAGEGANDGYAGVAGGAGGAVATGSLEILSDAKVCVQTPGSAARGGGIGEGGRLGAGCLDGSSSI